MNQENGEIKDVSDHSNNQSSELGIASVKIDPGQVNGRATGSAGHNLGVASVSFGAGSQVKHG